MADVTPELAAFMGLVSDSFVRQPQVGAIVGGRIDETLAIELSTAFALDRGESDYKSHTRQLIFENRVSPDIAKQVLSASVRGRWSPITATTESKHVWFGDAYVLLGFGAVMTSVERRDWAATTFRGLHPTTEFGLGLRARSVSGVGVRLEVSCPMYIEAVYDTVLELKRPIDSRLALSWTSW